MGDGKASNLTMEDILIVKSGMQYEQVEVRMGGRVVIWGRGKEEKKVRAALICPRAFAEAALR